MESWESMEAIPLRSAGEITQAFVQLGFSDLRGVARYIEALRYGRNTLPERPLVVLEERCGTCSTKHALMRRLAGEQSIPMSLTVGIYEMSERNTPGIGRVLKQFGLSSLPEAHCYLRFRGKRIDLTGLAMVRGTTEPRVFLFEEDIEPDDVTGCKATLHKRFLESWNDRQKLRVHSLQQLWSIREQCIVALSGHQEKPQPEARR